MPLISNWYLNKPFCKHLKAQRTTARTGVLLFFALCYRVIIGYGERKGKREALISPQARILRPTTTGILARCFSCLGSSRSATAAVVLS